MTQTIEFKSVTKKPVTVKAVQMTEEFYDNILCKCTDATILINGYKVQADLDRETQEKIIFVDTLESVKEHLFRAKLNDWLIVGINGEIYACKPDIFDKTYDY